MGAISYVNIQVPAKHRACSGFPHFPDAYVVMKVNLSSAFRNRLEIKRSAGYRRDESFSERSREFQPASRPADNDLTQPNLRRPRGLPQGLILTRPRLPSNLARANKQAAKVSST